MGFFLFKSNERLRSSVERRGVTETLCAKPSAPTDACGGLQKNCGRGGVALTAEEYHEGVDPLGHMAHLPITDIIAFYTTFRSALHECPDIAGRKRLVATLKSVSSLMKLHDFSEENADMEGMELPIVKRMLAGAPAVRSRLAFALQNFCHVIDWEIENEEIERGSGLLAALRGELPAVRNGTPADGSEHEAKSIPRIDSFDPAEIYNQVLNTDRLPSLQGMAELLRRTNELLLQETNVVLVPAPCVVVGDIHGQKKDLIESVFVAGGPINLGGTRAVLQSELSDEERITGRSYLFLGDIVDRGPDSLGCLALLFAAKLMAPGSVHLLRGNHESPETNRSYGFLKECWERYPIDDVGDSGLACSAAGCRTMDYGWDLKAHPLWVLANEAFRSLPLCAVITGGSTCPPSASDSGTHTRGGFTLCAMHGGLSPFIAESIDGILAVNRFRDIVDGPLADLTWADPVTVLTSLPEVGGDIPTAISGDEGGDGYGCNVAKPMHGQERRFKHRRVVAQYREPVPVTNATVGHVLSSRGRGHNFGEDVTLRFLRKNRLNFIIRAHQCVMEGYEWQHQKRLLTLFSAPNYCGCGNKGSILIVHEHGDSELIQFEASNTDGDGESEGLKPAPVPPKGFRD